MRFRSQVKLVPIKGIRGKRIHKNRIKLKKFTPPPLNEDEIVIKNTTPPPPATFLHPKSITPRKQELRRNFRKIGPH